MTVDIALVFGILVFAVVFFVTGWLRMDLVALLVMGALAVTGLVSPAQALAGFSNPAVVTVGGMFVISAALGRTGVASILGRQVLRVARGGEAALIAVIMGTAGLLSAFMNNVGVAAMMLPVVMDLARRVGSAPSKLLMPLALGSLLGGLTTLIGTPPNILASEALRDVGLPPFRLFDFTPLGLLILVFGIGFVVLGGRHLLPDRDPRGEASRGSGTDLAQTFELHERFFTVRIPRNSPLAGRTLSESRLGSALGLHVLAILREGRPNLAPKPAVVLRAGDRLLVQGRPDLLVELRSGRHLVLEDDPHNLERLVSERIGLAEARVGPDSGLEGRSLLQSGFRENLGVVVLAIRRAGVPRRTHLDELRLQAGDLLLLQGARDRLATAAESPDLKDFQPLTVSDVLARYRLDERFFTLRVTDSSILAGKSIAQTRIGDAAGLTVLGIVRDGATSLMPTPEEVFHPGDLLLVKADPKDLDVLRGLSRIVLETDVEPPLEELESERVGLLEVVLAPRSSLVGMTPRQIGFRDKYGISVLAVWREGRAYRSNLRDMPLHFGDSLLVFGPRERLKLLAREPDFIVLSETVQEPPRRHLAPVATLILVATLAPVLLGWIHIAIAVVLGATAMVLSRTVTAQEAYRAIEWPAIVLIGGMLPLGTALAQTGAAAVVADAVVGTTGTFGPRGVLAGLALMTAIGAQVIPSAALVVLMAPIALSTAAELGLSPYALMMGVALSAASLSSPVAHPANVLVMGPGGYRYVDYLRLGLPLTLIVLLVVVGVLPYLFPLM
jgi:di/tricarboxylate transporter